MLPHGNYQSVATNEEDDKVRDSTEQQPRHGGLFEPGRPPQHSTFSQTSPREDKFLTTIQAEQYSATQASSSRNPFDLTSGRTGDGGSPAPSSLPTTAASSTIAAELADSDETSSLISSNTSSVAGEVYVQSVDLGRSHRVDIRGWQLVRNLEFWQLFAIMGILAGIGLMTIK